MTRAASRWLFADWPVSSDVRAVQTLRSGPGVSPAPFDSCNLGAHCGDAGENVATNREAVHAALKLPSLPRWLRQVHGTAVVRFDASRMQPTGPGPLRSGAPVAEALVPGSDAACAPDTVEVEADASVTSTAGIVLAILTADCLPVVFASQDGREIAAAHAGWRGLAAGVLEKTVSAMRSPASGLVAWFGAAAGPAAYEVGEEVRTAFVDRDRGAQEAFVATRPGHWLVDLYALARMRLAQAGVTRVVGGGLCTISDPDRFYSHRRDAATGRMATLAWIEPKHEAASSAG